MARPAFLAACALAAALGACRTSSSTGSAAPAGTPPGAEKIGVLAPLDTDARSLWLEAHGGGLVVIEILPHGSAVESGDVVVRLDPRAIDDEIRRAELELASSRVGHRATVERNRLEAEAAASALARAQAGLERARRALEAWKTVELELERRQDEIGKAYEEANVDDQVDELDQLTKMYEADELVDATEDIVIKRSQRGLALTRRANEISRDRARFRREVELALETERREEDFRAQAESVARLAAQREIDARARQDAEVRSAESVAEHERKLERLRRDRASFEIAAWRDGVFLHGSPGDYRPGKSPARYRRGDSLPARAEVFAIAAPEPASVALDVTEADRTTFGDGARVEVRVVGEDATKSAATLRVEPYARSLGTGELTFEARAALDAPLAGARYGMRARVAPLAAKPSP